MPGCGKSTIAEALKKRCPSFIILRMDELRRLATPQPTYSNEERDILYRGIIYTAKIMINSGHNVIIDATGNLRKWRELARETLPAFAEIYINCPLDVCRQREQGRDIKHSAPSDIYKKAESGSPVPGVNVPYEPPQHPEVTVESNVLSVEDMVERIIDFLNKQT